MESPCAGSHLNHVAAKKLLQNLFDLPVEPENIGYLERVLSPETELLGSVKPQLVEHLRRKIGAVNRFQLLKLVSLVVCPSPAHHLEECVAKALFPSRKEKRIIQKLIRSIPVLERLLEEPFDTARMSAFFLESGDETPEVALAAVIPKRDRAGHLDVCEEILSTFFEKYSIILQPQKLISGDDLIEMLGVKPGPQLATVLSQIHQAQITGEVEKKEEALQLARQLLKEG